MALAEVGNSISAHTQTSQSGDSGRRGRVNCRSAL